MPAPSFTYLPRIVDAEIASALQRAGVVVVEGPKACGKTTTALQIAVSSARLDRSADLRQAGLADPMAVLAGPSPRLIDEWQLVPDLWNTAKAVVDDAHSDGLFIFTGSATPADDIERHSGAMRFARVTMRPMSLAESGDSSQAVSLGGLWQGAGLTPTATATPLTAAAELLCRGGWPSNLRRDLVAAIDANHDYLRTIAGADIVTLDGIRRDPRKISALLFALARNSGTYVTNATLHADSSRYGVNLALRTIGTYLDALARLWLLIDQPAWNGHLRSHVRTRRSPKRHLVDPSLAAAALGLAPSDLVADHETFGQLFESLAFRDLSAYAQANRLEVRAFHDKEEREIDAVLVRGLQWAGLEVKLTATAAVLDPAAAKLAAIAKDMLTAPQFLAIVTATGPSYRRPDGVHVVSLFDLAP
jgi:predicted AAA+ superfamily ATPase